MDLKIVETLTASCLFALALILGGKLHIPGDIRRRRLMSFSVGATVAYIFVQLSPELVLAQEVLLRVTANQNY